MPDSIFREVEDQMKADPDGSYRAELIRALVTEKDKMVSAKLSLLPPEEYDLADAMEAAINNAIDIIKGYKVVDSDKTSTDEATEVQEEIAVNTVISC